MLKNFVLTSLFVTWSAICIAQKCECPLVPAKKCKEYCDKLLTKIHLAPFSTTTIKEGDLYKVSEGSDSIIFVTNIIQSNMSKSNIAMGFSNNNLTLTGLQLQGLFKDGKVSKPSLIGTKKYDVNMAVENGAYISISDTDIDARLKSLKIGWGSSQYFLVQGAVFTPKITYTISANNENADTTAQVFDRPIRTFYYLKEVVPTALGASDEIRFDYLEVSKPIFPFK